MAIKKRNTLRNKAASRSGAPSTLPVPIEPTTPMISQLTPDPIAFLHQPRESKKEKQQLKQSAFLSQIKEKNSNVSFEGISKSSIRRRKRKMRDDLKPKMQDLLTSLQNEEDLKDYAKSSNTDEELDDFFDNNNGSSKTVKIIKKSSIAETKQPGYVKIKKNEPNIRTQKGSKVLAINETKRFNDVLNNNAFKANPFGSLRELIQMKLEK